MGGSVIFVFGVGGMYCLGGVILLGMGGGGGGGVTELEGKFKIA